MAETQAFEFDVEADRKADQMAGERFGMPSNPEGLTTDTPDRDEQIAEAIAAQGKEEAPQSAEEVEYLKRRLGEQGNEIGELRRKAAEAEALRLQLQMIERRLNEGNRPAIDPNNIDLFQGIAPDQTFMSEAEKYRINRSMVALAQAMQQQLESIRNESNYNAVRAASGVSEAQEAEIVSQYPWVNSLSGKDRASAIVEMAKARAGAQAAPQKSANEAARQAARGAAYVEPSSSRGTTSASADSLEPAQDKLLRDIRSGKFKDAESMRAALRKVGTANVDNYGRRY